MVDYLQYDNVWVSRHVYGDAETKFYENLARATAVTPLAGEVAKARQLLIESRETFKDTPGTGEVIDPEAIKFFQKKVVDFEKKIEEILKRLGALEARVNKIEKSPMVPKVTQQRETHAIEVKKENLPKQQEKKEEPKKADNDDVDLFGSDSDEESEEAARIRQERLDAYNAKKAKKPVIVAKSNIILDVKPWDDETDMNELERQVRKIESDGLLWGASKLVPLAYGIHKLQISAVVEDDKVSVDWLVEVIQEIEEYVQSVDIAAFNKI